MVRLVDRSSRRSTRRWRIAFAWNLAAGVAASVFGCSIYSSPDGPEDLEAAGSSGSTGTTGGSSDGGSTAAGGSKSGSGGTPMGGEAGEAAGGSEMGGEGGASGSAAGSGGSEAGSGGSDGGSGGSAGSSGGSGGAGGASGGSGGSFAGSGGNFPVELARDKPSTGSSDQLDHAFSHGNDGDNGTRWCAVAGTFPQHWRTDLGALYELTSFEVRWEKGNSDYTYEVATSPDDVTYTPRVTRTASGQVQTAPMMAGTTGRFVRVTVTNATGNTWASFYEFKVFGRALSGS